MYIDGNHSEFKIIPHGQQTNNQSIHHTIGMVNVSQPLRVKTATKREINKPKQLIDICGPFLKKSGTFWVDLGWHESLSVLRRKTSPNFEIITFWEDLKTYFKSGLLKQLDLSFTNCFAGLKSFRKFWEAGPCSRESIKREIRSITMHWPLYYSVGPTFSTNSHKKTAENCQSYPQILNGERCGVSTLKVKKRFYANDLDPRLG